MPTTRPRHTLTETEALADVLDRAAVRFPEAAANRAELLRRVALDWARQEAEAGAARRAAILDVRGRFSGVYDRDEQESLDDDWPE